MADSIPALGELRASPVMAKRTKATAVESAERVAVSVETVETRRMLLLPSRPRTSVCPLPVLVSIGSQPPSVAEPDGETTLVIFAITAAGSAGSAEIRALAGGVLAVLQLMATFDMLALPIVPEPPATAQLSDGFTGELRTVTE